MIDPNFHTITLSDYEFLVGLILKEAENIIADRPGVKIRVIRDSWRADITRNRINVKVDAENRIISLLGIY